jgi:plastocyanin
METSSRSVLVVLVAGLALAGCGKDQKADKGAVTPPGAVQIVNFEFKPQKVVVKPGTTVTWTNEDTAIHDIKDTSPLATPVGKEMGKGDTFSITYAQPGSYSYICGIHNYMTGTVEVAP